MASHDKEHAANPIRIKATSTKINATEIHDLINGYGKIESFDWLSGILVATFFGMVGHGLPGIVTQATWAASLVLRGAVFRARLPLDNEQSMSLRRIFILWRNAPLFRISSRVFHSAVGQYICDPTGTVFLWTELNNIYFLVLYFVRG